MRWKNSPFRAILAVAALALGCLVAGFPRIEAAIHRQIDQAEIGLTALAKGIDVVDPTISNDASGRGHYRRLPLRMSVQGCVDMHDALWPEDTWCGKSSPREVFKIAFRWLVVTGFKLSPDAHGMR